MTGKKSTAKLHHYVPQGYLRGFATDQERIRVVPLDRSRQPYTPSVKNVAAQNHFHTVGELDESDAFEKVLSDFEGRALSIIRGFTNGEFPPSEEESWFFALYTALQSVRGPDARRMTEHLCATMVRLEVGIGGRKNVGTLIRENLGIDPTPEQENRIWNEATQPGGPSIGFSNLAHIQNAVETAIELTPYLAFRPWALVRFDQRSLITSDAPVSLVRRPDDEAWEGVGFATAWGVTFPLTRRLGLLMSDPMAMLKGAGADETRVQKLRAMVLAGRMDRIQPGTTAMEKLFNNHTAESAREYVFHHPEDERFVPADLPEPDLINIKPMGGLVDMDFDGESLFAPGRDSPCSLRKGFSSRLI
ncbi:MAG: DUF4238 domain-containing protein [Schaalia hyovaginalis]|uniref:DUF4238 domain-containing protein n=1 Tax=Schaalia hyovaginalis TaxID=29316 RepID=UPI0023F9E57E|nr:DUF4238 domain-containing protein [Schaalia hyovaginalis]MCI7672669.1 DUF4238 domain-containing protein [Schaalia hyovaginalis]MDY4261958.1 DUF4238 domain-containing protein [Schaalia hyovaginalis]MDY5505290.1 DUF4238 domain-containing protein [Schaalia hyovaginalis]